MRSVLDDMNIMRICCRIAFITKTETAEDMMAFGAKNTVIDDIGSTLNRYVENRRRVACDTGAISTIHDEETTSMDQGDDE